MILIQFNYLTITLTIDNIMDKINISYSLKDFMDYKDVNTYLPINLKSLCNDYGGTLIVRDIILKGVASVIDTFIEGKNPNDIIFKNSIIEYLNKLNPKNYSTIIEQLKQLSFTKYEYLATFGFDILQRAMTDTVAIKGIDVPDGQKSMLELYAGIISEFSHVSINDKGENISFFTIFMKLCQKYFDDFTDLNRPLDINNQYRVDNYKGFMNFLSVLFEKQIISQKIILICLNKIKENMDTTLWEKLDQNDCENTYEGYRRLLYKVCNVYSKKQLNDHDRTFIKNISNIHMSVKTQNDKYNKLRKFTMMAHKDLENKLNKLL